MKRPNPPPANLAQFSMCLMPCAGHAQVLQMKSVWTRSGRRPAKPRPIGPPHDHYVELAGSGHAIIITDKEKVNAELPTFLWSDWRDSDRVPRARNLRHGTPFADLTTTTVTLQIGDHLSTNRKNRTLRSSATCDLVPTWAPTPNIKTTGIGCGGRSWTCGLQPMSCHIQLHPPASSACPLARQSKPSASGIH
jgi:hypothetical protein